MFMLRVKDLNAIILLINATTLKGDSLNSDGGCPCSLVLKPDDKEGKDSRGFHILFCINSNRIFRPADSFSIRSF